MGGVREIHVREVQRTCGPNFVQIVSLPKLETTCSLNYIAKNNLLPPLLLNKRLEGVSKSHPGQSFSVLCGLS